MVGRAFGPGIIVVVASLVLACGGSAATVDDNPSSGLQKQKDGSATGNGATCSWSGTSLYEGTGQKDPTVYRLGDTFPSLDGCNTCSCTAQGISCTLKACGGSSSSSSGNVGCTDDAMICPDGTAVGRTGPNCTFPACPTGGTTDGGTSCPKIAKQCPDGTVVGPTGPKCELICPTLSCDALAQKASTQVNAVLNANMACESADQCTHVGNSTDCYAACSAAVNKNGVEAFNAAVKDLNGSVCKAYKAQGCTHPLPPCVAPLPPKCVDKRCQ